MIPMQPTEHLVGINVQGDYFDFEAFVSAAARAYGCSIHEVHDPDLDFPEEIEW